MSLIKSKQRVADHGEVFTPPWMVEAMIAFIEKVVRPMDLVGDDAEDAADGEDDE